MPQKKSREIEVTERFIDAWNRRDLDAAMVCMTDDCVYESGAGVKYQGKAKVREAVGQVFELMPDIHFKLGGYYFFTPQYGAVEWAMKATHKTQGPLELRGCDLLSFRGGLISGFSGFAKQTSIQLSKEVILTRWRLAAAPPNEL